MTLSTDSSTPVDGWERKLLLDALSLAPAHEWHDLDDAQHDPGTPRDDFQPTCGSCETLCPAGAIRCYCGSKLYL